MTSGSDCSSEVSSVCTSMPSTSQLGNYGNRLPDNKKNINNHLNIDTRQLYDPDSLWKRNKYRYFIYPNFELHTSNTSALESVTL